MAGPAMAREHSWSSSSYNRLTHMCDLNIETKGSPRMTGIIATIGPACDSFDILQKMMVEGMNICRLNLAYRTYQYFVDVIQRIRQAANNLSVSAQVAVGVDINGPGIRLGLLKEEFKDMLSFTKGDKVKFSLDRQYYNCGDRDVIYANFDNIMQDIVPGNNICIEDGLSFVITEKGPDYVCAEVIEEGDLTGRMLFSVPRVLPGKPMLTDSDKEILKFVKDHRVDIIFASFAWSADYINQIRKELEGLDHRVKIVSKIENYEGVKRCKEILESSDGILIARGSLGIDIPTEKVFIAQKMLIGQANRMGKPVICATQILASMIKNPRPTRAEVADVANAILDGADCLMLSRETARGKDPVNVLKSICAICRESETAMFSEQVFKDLRMSLPMDKELEATHTTAIAAVEASIKCHAKAIVVVTATGRSAGLISKYRPRCVIVAVTRTPETARCLHLHRGVFPVLHEAPKGIQWVEDIDKRIYGGLTLAKMQNYLLPGDPVVLVTGWTAGTGATNTIRVMTVPNTDELEPLFQLIHVSSDNMDI